LKGSEAKKLFEEAQILLNEIITQGSLEARGVVAFYPANSVGDDIIIFDPVTIQ
jgi:5-methyltetrahydrofolate--homocysteine methyltransferase